MAKQQEVHTGSWCSVEIHFKLGHFLITASKRHKQQQNRHVLNNVWLIWGPLGVWAQLCESSFLPQWQNSVHGAGTGETPVMCSTHHRWTKFTGFQLHTYINVWIWFCFLFFWNKRAVKAVKCECWYEWSSNSSRNNGQECQLSCWVIK